MRPLPEIRGLKVPDDFVVRHFFKRGLAERSGRVVELGSGTGNNLGLYLAYGWACVGVDYDPAALADARWNLGEAPEFVTADLSQGPPPLTGAFDALIIPNLLCYLTSAQARALLTGLRPHLPPGAEVFVRTRALDDYRHGRGREEEPHGFRLETPETGEAGLFNLFYTVETLSALMAETLGLADPVLLTTRFDNLQSGRLIANNSDLILWGQMGGRAP